MARPLRVHFAGAIYHVTSRSVGEDPVGKISAQMVQCRLKQRQKTLLAMLRGGFGSAERD